ncbi:hypothetical protein U6B65_00425 [Oscillospiraceae bacterium MB08-C2-2]|nr:hypothetical protein U6B65_00425 [Oscillospiraceae bacterium MB08-C2-2]
MRIRLLLLALLVLLTGTGCAKKQDTQKPSPDVSAALNAPFSTSANISYKELAATAVLSRETPQACTVTFSSPASLKDMSFMFTQDLVTIRYKGLSFDVDPADIPTSNAARIAVAAINKVTSDQGLTVDYTDTALAFSGVMESGAFTLKLDRENGSLLKLSVPSEELEIEFVSFEFLA